MKHFLAGIVLSALTMTASLSVDDDNWDEVYEIISGISRYLDHGPNFEEMSYRETSDWLIDIVEEKHPISYILRDVKCVQLYKSRQRISEIGPPEEGGRFVHENLVTVVDLESVTDLADCDKRSRSETLDKDHHSSCGCRSIDYDEYEAYDFSELQSISVPEHHNVRMLICGEHDDSYPDLDCIEGSIKHFEGRKGTTVFELKEETDLPHHLMPVISVPNDVVDAILIELALNRLIELARLANENERCSIGYLHGSIPFMIRYSPHLISYWFGGSCCPPW